MTSTHANSIVPSDPRGCQPEMVPRQSSSTSRNPFTSLRRTSVKLLSRIGVVDEEYVVIEKLVVRDDVHEVRIAERRVLRAAGHVDGPVERMLGILALHPEELIGGEEDVLACFQCRRRADGRRWIVGEHGSVVRGHELPRHLLGRPVVLVSDVRPRSVRDGGISRRPPPNRRTCWKSPSHAAWPYRNVSALVAAENGQRDGFQTVSSGLCRPGVSSWVQLEHSDRA